MLRLFCQNCNRVVDAVPAENPSDGVIGLCPDCGAGLEAHRYIAPGTIINGFRVESEIGRGGMGVVYLAKQLDLDRDIALKVLSDEMASDAVFVEAFFREARAAAALNHPNIVQAIDAGTADNGLHYFVMELITGDNLELHTRQNGPLSYELAFKCATQIADALTFAWETKKLAHRDIKPENIILTKRNDFKLADLGLAKDYHDNAIESEDELMATPAYASPEVIRGEMDKIGFKSDMYSFGATLYQLFAGRPPFEGNDPMELCQKQLDEQPKPLIGIKPDLPSRLSRLIDRLMEKNPEKRPAQWADVLRDLNSIAREWQQRKNGNVPELKNITVPETGTMDPGTKIRIIIVACLLFLALILAVAIICIHVSAKPERKEIKKEVKIIQTVVPKPEVKEEEPEATVPEPETEVVPEPEIKEKEESEPEQTAFEIFRKTLPANPYEQWCNTRKYIMSRGDLATQEERDFFAKLTDEYMTPFGGALLKDMDDLTTKVSLVQLNDLQKMKELKDQLDAVLHRAERYPEWLPEICKNDEFTEFKELHTKFSKNYLQKKSRQEKEEMLGRQKESMYINICSNLHSLSGKEIIEKVDIWTKQYEQVLTGLDRSNAFRLKNLAGAKDMTLLKFLQQHAAAFVDQELFPEIYPGLQFVRFSATGKVMILKNRNETEYRKKAEIFSEHEAKFLLELLTHPEVLENLSTTEKKMLINRAFFLKISKEKFRSKICRTPDDEKFLFQDVNALPEYIFAQ